MTEKRLTLLAILALLAALVSSSRAGRLLSAPVSEASNVTESRQKVPSTDSQTGISEYRVLLSRRNDDRGRRLANPLEHLEDEINKLAAQGYVVESFKAFASVTNTGNEAVVLLRRTKK